MAVLFTCLLQMSSDGLFPLICRSKPIRTVQVWTEEVLSILTGGFQRGLRSRGLYVCELSYVQFSTDAVLPTKIVKVFPNQKLWMDDTLWSLLKAMGYSNA